MRLTYFLSLHDYFTIQGVIAVSSLTVAAMQASAGPCPQVRSSASTLMGKVPTHLHKVYIHRSLYMLQNGGFMTHRRVR